MDSLIAGVIGSEKSLFDLPVVGGLVDGLTG